MESECMAIFNCNQRMGLLLGMEFKDYKGMPKSIWDNFQSFYSCFYWLFLKNCFARNEIKSIATLTLSQLNSEIGVNRGHSPLYQSWAWVMAKLTRMTNSFNMFLSWNPKLKWTRLSVYVWFHCSIVGGLDIQA